MQDKLIVSPEKIEVISNNVSFIMDSKPKLSFAYDFLYFEPALGTYIYYISECKFTLSDKQISECTEFCNDFINEQDYDVYTYNKDSVFNGIMAKSKAQELNLLYCLESPEYLVSKWTNKKWERIVLIVKDDGSIIKNPDTYCDQCALFLTQKELDKNIELQQYNDKYHKWDIENSQWIIVGDEFSDLYRTIDRRIRELFEIKRWKLYNKFTPSYERMEWYTEYTEALSFIADENALTPYINGILATVTNNITKKEYIDKILSHNTNEFKFEHGKIHGEMYNYINRLKCITTLEELKEYFSEIFNIKYESIY